MKTQKVEIDDNGVRGGVYRIVFKQNSADETGFNDQVTAKFNPTARPGPLFFLTLRLSGWKKLHEAIGKVIAELEPPEAYAPGQCPDSRDGECYADSPCVYGCDN